MDGLGNIILEGKEIINERIEVTHKSAHYFLGPNLTLRDCTVILKVSARRLFFDAARFINCTFEVKQELKNHQQWVYAYLKGCRFKGRLCGCDFGYWPEYSSQSGGQYGFVEDCDFTEAQMDGCRILGCDPNSLRFPKWPYFTILDPLGHAADLRGAPWPDLFGRVIINHLHEHPDRTQSLTLSATAEAKKLETTPEALKAVLERFDCVVY